MRNSLSSLPTSFLFAYSNNQEYAVRKVLRRFIGPDLGTKGSSRILELPEKPLIPNDPKLLKAS